jgi:hypothetical protein
VTFDPATAPYPYATEDGEPYVFPVEHYPTEADVRAWFAWTDEELTDWDIKRGRYRVHDHDEDFEGCERTPDPDEPCPQSRVIEGWWAA